MNTLHLLLGLPWVQSLGWTLLHFLWQGALIGLAASVLFRTANRASARVRYLLACGLLCLCVATPLLTFAILMRFPFVSASTPQLPPTALVEKTRVAQIPHASLEATPASPPGPKSFSTVHIEQVRAGHRGSYFAGLEHSVRAAKAFVRWIVPLWLVGVLAMGLRLGAAWARIQIWRFTAVPVIDAAILDLFSRLCGEMHFAQKVRLLLSDKINVPLTLGWMRPVILVPAQILTGLTAEELKAVLAHELAHIARYDYLINLFQSVIEIVLFYHPAVWWISGKIRESREECCDEAALRMGADRMVYAQTLASIAESGLPSHPALGAAGGSLFQRIARLLGKPRPEPAWNRSHAAWALSLAGAFLLVLAIFYSSKSIADPVAGKSSLSAVKKTTQSADAQALHTAALKGDLAGVRRLLGTGLDLKTNPLLHDLVQDAALGENFEVLQLLLDHGMDINGRNERGETALAETIGEGQENVSHFLIEHGIDVNQSDNQGTPPAWWAANLDFSRSNVGPATGSLAILELLRQKGARFNGRNKNGATIFTYMMHVVPPDAHLLDEKMPAMVEQQKDFEAERRTIQILLAGGADPNALDSWLHETSLIDALESGHHVAAQALLDAGVDVNKPDNKGNPPIVFSVLRGWGEPVPIAIVKQMLARGADPNSRTQGENLLDSLPKESTSALELLLEQRGNGAIDEASDRNLNEAVQLLLTHGARFTGSLSSAIDHLLRAASAGDLPGLKEAVAQGASISAADADGWTPLMVALSLGHEDCVAWLLANGADVKTKNAQGYSPLFFAVIRQQAQRVDEFLAKGADPNCGDHRDFIGRSTTIGSALWQAVVQTNLPIFKSLIAAGANATPDEVSQAIRLGQVEMVRTLLDKGSPPDYPKPYENRGSVYWAVDYNHPEILKLLLDHGADPELKTDYNETPLSIAKQWHKDMVPILEAAIAKKHGKAGSAAKDFTLDPDSGTSGSKTGPGTTVLTSTPAQPEDLKAFFANPRNAQTIWLRSDAEIRAGHLATVEEFLKAGFNPNGDSYFGTSSPPLYTATCTQQPAMVDLLLKYGADPRHKTSQGDLAIWAACWRGNKEIADKLLAAGGNPNPIRYAAGLGDIAALKALDDRQPLTKDQIHDGLLFATASGHLNTFDWLWAKVSNLDAKAKDDLLVGLYNGAIQMDHLDVFKHLESLHSAPEKARSHAFELAIDWANPDIVKYLLEKGVSPNATLAYAYPPLLRTIGMSSGRKDPLETIRVLLDHGADINGSRPEGKTALMSALESDEFNVAELLLQRGADINAVDGKGVTAAMSAASRVTYHNRTLGMLEELIDKGARVTGTDKEGETILEQFVTGIPPRHGGFGLSGEPFDDSQVQYFHDTESRVLGRLIDAGADVNPTTGYAPPLLMAIRFGRYDAARFLLDHGASIKTTGGQFKRGPLATFFSITNFSRPYTEEGLQFLELMLKRGADANEQTWAWSKEKRKESLPDLICLEACRDADDLPSNREALLILFAHGGGFGGVKSPADQAMLQAAVVGDIQKLQQASAQGAAIDAQDEIGITPLILTTRFGNDDATRWLVDKGANLNARSWHGLTPLLDAVASQHIDMVDLLLAKGAKLSPGGNELDMSIQGGDRKMFDFLLKAGAKPGTNSLIACIVGQRDDMVQTLLDDGANPQPPPYYNNQGTVWWAATEQRAGVVKMLLDHGADPTWKTKTGQTTVEAAGSSREVAALLRDAINQRKK